MKKLVLITTIALFTVIASYAEGGVHGHKAKVKVQTKQDSVAILWKQLAALQRADRNQAAKVDGKIKSLDTAVADNRTLASGLTKTMSNLVNWTSGLADSIANLELHIHGKMVTDTFKKSITFKKGKKDAVKDTTMFKKRLVKGVDQILNEKADRSTVENVELYGGLIVILLLLLIFLAYRYKKSNELEELTA
jgi:hypothetical protein